MDYCNTVLAGAPRTVTDKLQRVLNAAARVIIGTRKFDRGLGQILHDQLHWLDVPDRVLLAQHLRPSGVLGCWPDGLELTPDFIRGPTSSTDCFRRLLKTYLLARY